MSKGAELITAERQRQVDVEGWDANHDRHHTENELVDAAVSYLFADAYKDGEKPLDWPWEMKWWKPSPNDRVRELVKAGALIAAEIDRQLGEK